MSELSDHYRVRVAEEARRRRETQIAMDTMDPQARSQVAAGMEALRYLLDRLPRSYRGPFATAHDCASIANVDAFLERNKITPLPTAKGDRP